ncbi:MAG: type II secretion system protein [Kiritimatiellae bacterium]|nr:type II secretion system protein [Kiritimatiellia bacterium]
MNPRSSRSGFTLAEILIVVGIIGLLAALVVPAVINARMESHKSVCLNALRQIDSAKEQWAFATGSERTVTPTWADLNDYIKKGAQECRCPSDPTQTPQTSYSINPLSSTPTCRNMPADHILY